MQGIIVVLSFDSNAILFFGGCIKIKVSFTLTKSLVNDEKDDSLRPARVQANRIVRSLIPIFVGMLPPIIGAFRGSADSANVLVRRYSKSISY